MMWKSCLFPAFEGLCVLGLAAPEASRYLDTSGLFYGVCSCDEKRCVGAPRPVVFLCKACDRIWRLCSVRNRERNVNAVKDALCLFLEGTRKRGEHIKKGPESAISCHKYASPQSRSTLNPTSSCVHAPQKARYDVGSRCSYCGVESCLYQASPRRQQPSGKLPGQMHDTVYCVQETDSLPGFACKPHFYTVYLVNTVLAFDIAAILVHLVDICPGFLLRRAETCTMYRTYRIDFCCACLSGDEASFVIPAGMAPST